MMNLRGMYEEKISKRKLRKLDKWRKVEGLGYRSVFEVEEGVVELRLEYEVNGFSTNDTIIVNENEINGVTLYFDHPKDMTHQGVVEQLKEVLPENCYDIKLAGDLCVFYYSIPGLKATDLSKSNQNKALALHPSFFLEEIDVELYITIMTDIHSGESKIFFSHYLCSPIINLCVEDEDEDERVLYINERDPLFQYEYNRYSEALKQLGWEHMNSEEIKKDSIFDSSIYSNVLYMGIEKKGDVLIPKGNNPTNLVLFPQKGEYNAMPKVSKEDQEQNREPELNIELELNNQPELIREQEHTREQEHNKEFSEATEIISLFKMLPEKQRKVTLNYLIHML
ncbi:hypothetical protein MZM54_04895 [[Brevibacterium] frigoritolerans]|nr:hypothetical protein [Peribacillus frigoritolerans]